MKRKTSFQRVSIDGMRPLALAKKQIISALESAKLVDRMLWAIQYAGGALVFDQAASSSSIPFQIWKNSRPAAYYPASRTTKIWAQIENQSRTQLGAISFRFSGILRTNADENSLNQLHIL